MWRHMCAHTGHHAAAGCGGLDYYMVNVCLLTLPTNCGICLARFLVSFGVCGNPLCKRSFKLKSRKCLSGYVEHEISTLDEVVASANGWANGN